MFSGPSNACIVSIKKIKIIIDMCIFQYSMLYLYGNIARL